MLETWETPKRLGVRSVQVWPPSTSHFPCCHVHPEMAHAQGVAVAGHVQTGRLVSVEVPLQITHHRQVLGRVLGDGQGNARVRGAGPELLHPARRGVAQRNRGEGSCDAAPDVGGAPHRGEIHKTARGEIRAADAKGKRREGPPFGVCFAGGRPARVALGCGAAAGALRGHQLVQQFLLGIDRSLSGPAPSAARSSACRCWSSCFCWAAICSRSLVMSSVWAGPCARHKTGNSKASGKSEPTILMNFMYSPGLPKGPRFQLELSHHSGTKQQ